MGGVYEFMEGNWSKTVLDVCGQDDDGTILPCSFNYPFIVALVVIVSILKVKFSHHYKSKSNKSSVIDTVTTNLSTLSISASEIKPSSSWLQQLQKLNFLHHTTSPVSQSHLLSQNFIKPPTLKWTTTANTTDTTANTTDTTANTTDTTANTTANTAKATDNPLLSDIDINLSAIAKRLTLNLEHMTDHVTSYSIDQPGFLEWRDDVMEWREEGGSTNCIYETSVTS